ncbi:hypothetical protein [Streptomyces mangrovisoli]|uniref:Uncharacterized protein n=1 Tax=Streptomyces mangrovisoli TaxID=1428628 RepID=A0A1J4P8E5_9ACTN|nr:hypothetical protein [Streptomyces mangrovisoli]OIJ69790.1 hypothetical protein WN71_000985 [Streptomyces mangrovisoli]
MAMWEACLWGLLGAALVELRGLWSALQPSRKPKWPWKDGRGRPQVWGYVVAVVCRFGMAAGLDAVYAAAHQIAGPLGAVTMGIAAPLVIQQMAVRADSPPVIERAPLDAGEQVLNGRVEARGRAAGARDESTGGASVR